MDILKTVDHTYSAFYKQLRKGYKTLTLRYWAVRHSSKKVLTSEQEKEIKAFFEPYHNVSTLFHEYYTEKTGYYSEKYLPHDLYINYIDPYFNDAKKAIVLENKCYFKRMFPDVRHPDLLCYRLNNFWFDGDDRIIDLSEAQKLISSEPATVVKQAAGSSGGHAVTFLEGNSQKNVKEFLRLADVIQDDIIVQRPIRQHPQLSRLNSSSVNSYRIVSLLRENDVKICSVVLRMGIDGMKVDNESSGGVNCGVREDGSLRRDGHTKETGECYQVHPTSGIRFEGYVVPGYDKVIETVRRIHPMVPHFRLVSWDFTIDENGEPIFIEANLNSGGLHINQINNGPLFGDDTKEILDEVFHIQS